MLSSGDFSGEEKPLVAGFMRGYRAWRPAPVPFESRPVREGEKLRSSNASYVWARGRNVAACNSIVYMRDNLAHWDRISQNHCRCGGCGSYDEQLARRLDQFSRLLAHQIPSNGPDCKTCGFYALHNLRQFREAVAGHMYIGPAATIYGSIKATGAVIIGTKGFRAQYAEIEALAGPNAEPYAKYYDVPWFPEGLDSLARAFPATTVEGIDEPVAVADFGYCSYRVDLPGFSSPITGLAPTSGPDPTEPDRDVPDPKLDADPIPMDPEPADGLRKWLNPRVWRRG
jgi:hypothetical protein